MMGKNNVPVRYSRGLGQGRTGQEDAREAGKNLWWASLKIPVRKKGVLARGQNCQKRRVWKPPEQ